MTIIIIITTTTSLQHLVGDSDCCYSHSSGVELSGVLALDHGCGLCGLLAISFPSMADSFRIMCIIFVSVTPSLSGSTDMDIISLHTDGCCVSEFQIKLMQ
jgi:hypothetical protein